MSLVTIALGFTTESISKRRVSILFYLWCLPCFIGEAEHSIESARLKAYLDVFGLITVVGCAAFVVWSSPFCQPPYDVLIVWF